MMLADPMGAYHTISKLFKYEKTLNHTMTDRHAILYHLNIDPDSSDDDWD